MKLNSSSNTTANLYLLVSNSLANNHQLPSSSNLESVGSELLVLQSFQQTPQPQIIALLPNDQPSTSSAVIATIYDHDGEQEGECDGSSLELDSKVVVEHDGLQENDDEDNISITNNENVSPNTSEKRSTPGDRVELLKSNKRHASTEMKFRSFNVNWSKVSDDIVDRLNRLQEYREKHPGVIAPKNIRMPKIDITNLVNTIVGQMRSIDTAIPASIMESVAQQVYTKYSGLQFIDDDGLANPQSYVRFKHQLINRNSYLNRFKGPDSRKVSVAEVRRNKNIKAGTMKEYWAMTSESCPKDVLGKLARDDPKILSEEFLSVSQPYVRFRLDEPQHLLEIVNSLPVLRRRQLIRHHFEKATGVPAFSFEKLFVSKREKIVHFLKSRPKITVPEVPSDFDVILALCSLLGEKATDLVIRKELGTKSSEITTECAGPVLVSVDLGNDNRIFYVFAEQVRLTEGTNDAVTAVTDLLAVHYMYNFMYMKTVSKFLEFIQAYFFKIVPTTGSKSKATRKSKQQRLVQSIIEELSNHECPHIVPAE